MDPSEEQEEEDEEEHKRNEIFRARVRVGCKASDAVEFASKAISDPRVMAELLSKKNTDCVYFLASPLTCKKGIQCEFRHSEVARLNPRDCWYWLSGNCLNPDCPFRHPPLDAAEEENPEPASKGRVPCYFYSQGYCAKGDKCPFMHGYPRIFNQTQAQSAPASAAQNPGVSKATAATTTATETTETGARKNVPPIETLNEGQFLVPEDANHIEGQVEYSSPNDYQQQEEDSDKSDEVVHRQLRHQDWMRESSPVYDAPEDPGAEQDLYCEDDDNYDRDEEAVTEPGNGTQFIGQFQGLHRVPDVEPAYDFQCRYEQGSLQDNGIGDSYSDYKLYDPPYQPSVPYDFMISSRQQQGFAEEQRIDPNVEALLMSRNLGMDRRRLEDRLVFPKGSNRGLLANRLKYFNTNNNNSLNRHEDEHLAGLCSHPLRARLDRPGNLHRMANGTSVHNRLGMTRSSVKSRLQGRLRYANQRFHPHHHQHQQQHHQQHRNHQSRNNSRYLGIVQHWKHKVSKRQGGSKPGAAAAAAAAASTVRINLKDSQFDGPKSLAELKAAKTVEDGTNGNA